MLQYPRRKLGDSCADPGQIGLGTANTPGDDAGQEETAILRLGLEKDEMGSGQNPLSHESSE